MTTDTDARLEWVLDAIFNQPDTPAGDDPREPDAPPTDAQADRMWGAQADHAADRHEAWLDRIAHQ